tara:strand:+ start:69 stop:371 length:303 start_codon:yes stop_codon:yes gene_type:complete
MNYVLAINNLKGKLATTQAEVHILVKKLIRQDAAIAELVESNNSLVEALTNGAKADEANAKLLQHLNEVLKSHERHIDALTKSMGDGVIVSSTRGDGTCH